MNPKVEWTDEEQLAEILGVTAGACTYCRGAARVPEDVVCVFVELGVQQPFIVCESCTPKFMEMLEDGMNGIKDAIREALREMGEERP